MRSVLQTAPASEPISLEEAKGFLRVSTTAEDTLISAIIVAARQHCENHTKRAFINQTWDLWLDTFPAGAKGDASWWDGTREGSISSILGKPGSIELPVEPYSSLSSVVTYDDEDTETTFDSSYLIKSAAGGPGRITLKTGRSWPVSLRPADAIRIRYVAGYGASGAAVPAAIKQAMYLLIGHWFEHREAIVTGTISSPIQLGVNALLSPYVGVRL